MSEHENELARASAENGPFDPEKAKKLTSDAVSQFSSRLKWAGRITWGYLLICVAVMIVACNGLLAASSTKAIVGFGILLLVAYETTILLKLWYWVVNTKITLLKELRQWKLQMAFSSAAASSLAEAEEQTPHRDLGISRRERIAWFAVLIVVCIAVSGYRPQGVATPVPPAPPAPRAAIIECATLKADGGATTFLQTGGRATMASSSFDFAFAQPENVKSVRWLDDRGRELPVEVVTENGQRCYTVRMIEPDVPGEWQRMTQITEYRSAATEKGGVWTYANDYQHGLFRTEYNVTIELPRGAKVVAVDPKPVAQWPSNGIERLAFQATTGPSEHFCYEVKYRLADEADAKKTP